VGEYPIGFALNELAALERAAGDNAKGSIGESDTHRVDDPNRHDETDDDDEEYTH
jgi:hypothetical protein